MMSKSMKHFVFSSLLTLAVLLAPSLALAQQNSGGNTCLYPLRRMLSFGRGTACITQAHCPFANQVCDAGYCKVDPSYKAPSDEISKLPDTASTAPVIAANTPTASQECDADRRCRLDRLRRTNNARRYSQMLREEERALQLQKDFERERIESEPRVLKPLGTEFYVSFGFGPALSYTFLGHYRLEGFFTYIDSYFFGNTTLNGMNVYYDGSIDGWNGGAALTYLFRKSWWTPYLSLAMLSHSGSLNTYSYNDGGVFGDFGNSSDLKTVIHAAEARLGFDVQFKIGARTRLGILYRQPIYVQAKYGAGQYDDASRQMLKAWLKSERRIAPEFSIGWAF